MTCAGRRQPSQANALNIVRDCPEANPRLAAILLLLLAPPALGTNLVSIERRARQGAWLGRHPDCQREELPPADRVHQSAGRPVGSLVRTSIGQRFNKPAQLDGVHSL